MFHDLTDKNFCLDVVFPGVESPELLHGTEHNVGKES